VRFELTTSALPRRRSVHWSYRGDFREQDSNLRAPISRNGRDAATHPGMEPSPGADPGLLPYRGRVTAVYDGKAPAQAMAVASASRSTGSPCLRRCWVSSVRFERTLPSASCWCLLPLGYEDVEPPPGADPGRPPYEGEAAAVRGGVSCPARIRTSIA
jgi:hypothetical protein